MHVKSLSLLLPLVSALLFRPAIGHPAGSRPSAAVISNAERSVVQVINFCTNHTGSGFFWKDSLTVVTALHVVSGSKCGRILGPTVYIDAAHQEVAQVSRISLGSDLALLALSKDSHSPVLSIAAHFPLVGDELQVLGYPAGVPSRTSAALSVIYGDSPTLETLLPGDVRQRISHARLLSLSTTIVRIGGPLVPGYSGAPIINAAGNVVAVGSGGLLNGLAGIGWGIRSDNISSLATSTDHIAATTLPVREAFAFSRTGQNLQEIRCGGQSLLYSDRRTLADVIQTADDSSGVVALATQSGLNPEIIGALEVDIYVEPHSGATLAIPSGAKLRETEGECVATVDDNITIRTATMKVSSPEDLLGKSALFEVGFDRQDKLWIYNPAYSYSGVAIRRDGLVRTRKAASGFRGGSQVGFMFETLLERGNTFLGVQAVNQNLNADAWNSCRLASADDDRCNSIRIDLQHWVAATLGAYLSTASIR